MGQSLHIDPERVRALMAELNAVAEAAHLDLTELKDTLARAGRPWGDDEPGRMIGEAYEPQAKKGLEGYHNLVENLRELSKGVGEVSDALHDQDRNNAQQLSNAGSNQPATNPAIPVQTGDRTYPISSPGLDSGANADNGNTTGTAPNASVPASVTQPNTYPQSAPTGYNPVDGTTPLGQQPSYPGTGTPQTGPGSSAQPGGEASDRDGQNAASPSAADDPVPAASAAPAATSPGATAAPRTPDAKASVAEKAAGTPWSKAPGTTTPPSQSGTPWSEARTGAGRPGQIFAPSPAGPGVAQPGEPKPKAKSRKKKRASTVAEHVRTPTDAAALAAARELADRHELRIVGFENSGIGPEMVAQLAAAIDSVLARYPFVDLGGIEITELGDGRISRVTSGRAEDEASTGSWILLDRALVANPAQFSEKVSSAIQSGNSVAGSEERPMYSTIIGDLGRIMAEVAGEPIRRLVQRSLITEYQRIDGPWGGEDTLARIAGRYRRWRDQLGANCFVEGRFHPGVALATAFAEVELRGDAASGPARVLCRLLVEGARGRSAPR